MSVTIDQGEANCTIQLEGEVDINSAVEFKQVLLAALQSGKQVCLDLRRATDLDVTALQLLWAANREAQKLDISFTLAGIVSQALIVAAREAGFEDFPISLKQQKEETVPAR